MVHDRKSELAIASLCSLILLTLIPSTANADVIPSGEKVINVTYQVNYDDNLSEYTFLLDSVGGEFSSTVIKKWSQQNLLALVLAPVQQKK